MDQGFGSWVTKRAFLDGPREAVVDLESGRRLTMGELEVRSNRLANALRDRGVRRGDRIAVLMYNAAEFFEIIVAVAKLGAIAVPVNFRLSPPEIAHVLHDAGARVLFRSEELRHVSNAAFGFEGVEVLLTVTVPTPDVRRAQGPSEYEDLVASGSEDWQPAAVAPSDVAMIMYTSGTTGRSKGAVITHANIFASAVNYLTIGKGLTREDRSLNVAPLFHIGALICFGLPLLYVGGTNITQQNYDPARALRALVDEGVTVQFLVPSMWADLAAVEGFDGHDLSALKYVLSGGAPCPITVIEFYQDRGIDFLEGFGMTETTAGVCLLESEFVISRAGSVGRPMMHVDTRIIDDEGRDVPVDEVGELAVRGPNIFSGYWGLSQETREAFVDGWFRTGDLGRIDEDGFLTLVDRKKDMVISGGENVYPVEVEQVMIRHDAVREVAVIGRQDERWGETVVAVVACTSGYEVAADELIAWTRERIAHYKAPREIVFVPELPRNATGKILKRELRAAVTGDETTVHR